MRDAKDGRRQNASPPCARSVWECGTTNAKGKAKTWGQKHESRTFFCRHFSACRLVPCKRKDARAQRRWKRRKGNAFPGDLASLRYLSSAFGCQPESGAGARAPETAIQPGPVAVNTTRYKSIQVNITKKIRASSMQAHLPLAMSRKGGRQKNGGEKMSCSHLFAPIFLPIRARAGSPLQAGADEAG